MTPRTRSGDDENLDGLPMRELEARIKRVQSRTLKDCADKARPLLKEWLRRRQGRALTSDEKRTLLRGFSPVDSGPGERALTNEIDRLRAENPNLSYDDAYVEVGRRDPALASLWLAESGGARPLPAWPGMYDHHRGVLAAAWAEAERIYRSIPVDRLERTVPPAVAQHFLSRWQPVYYVDDHGYLMGTEGDDQYARDHADAHYRPRYQSASLLRLAINLEFSAEDILQAVEAILRRIPKEARRRQRYTPNDIADIIRWYYRRRSGISLKNLAVDEAYDAKPGVTRRRMTKRAATLANERAYKQALDRVRSGIDWFERQFLPKPID